MGWPWLGVGSKGAAGVASTGRLQACPMLDTDSSSWLQRTPPQDTAEHDRNICPVSQKMHLRMGKNGRQVEKWRRKIGEKQRLEQQSQ